MHTHYIISCAYTIPTTQERITGGEAPLSHIRHHWTTFLNIMWMLNDIKDISGTCICILQPPVPQVDFVGAKPPLRSGPTLWMQHVIGGFEHFNP